MLFVWWNNHIDPNSINLDAVISLLVIAVIGGLVVSTLLSLLFVPALFAFMDDIGRFSERVAGRLMAGSMSPRRGVDK